MHYISFYFQNIIYLLNKIFFKFLILNVRNKKTISTISNDRRVKT